MAALEPSDADAHEAITRREMYEHSCAKAGAVGCNWVLRANSEEDLKRKVIDHARKKHNVQGMTDTIYTYLRAQAQKA
jgi:predicted small metal-binding protein